MASSYTEALRPGVQPAVPDAAVSLSALNITPLPTIPTTEVIPSISETTSTLVLSPEEELRRKRRRALRELRPLGMTSNSVDLSLDLSIYKENVRYSQTYEEDCFNKLVGELGENEIAYGPHLLTLALGADTREQLEIGGRSLAIPDAIVGEVGSWTYLDAGVLVEAGAVRIKRLIEFKMGDLDLGRKTVGFGNLLGGIRRNPDEAAKLLNRILKGRGGRMNPWFLIAPRNNHVEVDFYSPKDFSEAEKDAYRRSLPYGGRNFKKIDFLQVPKREGSPKPEPQPTAAA